MASGILVRLITQLGIKPTPPALVARGLNYWITREAPLGKFLNFLSLGFLILKSRIIESGSDLSVVRSDMYYAFSSFSSYLLAVCFCPSSLAPASSFMQRSQGRKHPAGACALSKVVRSHQARSYVPLGPPQRLWACFLGWGHCEVRVLVAPDLCGDQRCLFRRTKASKD